MPYKKNFPHGSRIRDKAREQVNKDGWPTGSFSDGGTTSPDNLPDAPYKKKPPRGDTYKNRR